jgi:hypothetical protein
MRAVVIAACLSLVPSLCAANDLKVEDKIELTRGLLAEYATAKVMLPRSKKPLEFDANGTWDKSEWAEVAKQTGAAARTGDTVQITKLNIDEDKLVLEINHGQKRGGHWYDRVQVGMGPTVGPITQSGDSNAATGTYIAILFHKPLEPMKASDVKKMLAPILDFERRTATALYVDTLTPEMKQAVQEKRVIVGMTREQVILAVGRPAHKSRETNKDGVEEEDWVYGTPPGKITFVTFVGEKVTKVKDEYAGLGTEVADPPVVR